MERKGGSLHTWLRALQAHLVGHRLLSQGEPFLPWLGSGRIHGSFRKIHCLGKRKLGLCGIFSCRLWEPDQPFPRHLCLEARGSLSPCLRGWLRFTAGMTWLFLPCSPPGLLHPLLCWDCSCIPLHSRWVSGWPKALRPLFGAPCPRCDSNRWRFWGPRWTPLPPD